MDLGFAAWQVMSENSVWISSWLSKVAKLVLISIGRRIRMGIVELILGIYPLLSLVALFALRRNRLTGITQFLWALLIVAVPVMGALAFLIVNPTENIQSK